MKATRALLVGLTPVVLAACAVDAVPTPEANDPPPPLDPNDAYGDVSAPLPGGANVVDVGVLYELMKSGRPDFVTAKAMSALDVRAASQVTEDDETLAEYLTSEQDPNVAAMVAAKPTLDSHLRENSDGSLQMDVVGTDGTVGSVATFGRPTRRHTMAEVIRDGRSRVKREALYAGVKSALSGIITEAMPAPGELSDAALEDKLSLVARAGLAATSRVHLPLGTALEACGGEWDGDDASAEPPVMHDPSGLYARVSWSHKGATTCVRDQGARGTCSAFAVASALERKNVLYGGPRLDISEQHLYARYVSQYGDWRRDGAYPSDMVLQLSSVGFKVPVEADWRYNPARQRTPMQSSPFNGACKGYSGACSETSHEEPVSCTYVKGTTYCWWTSVKPAHPGGITITNDPSRPQFRAGRDYSASDRIQALAFAAALLSFGDREVVISFTIGTAFDAASKDPSGFVRGPSGGDRGGHATHAVGWVANDQLPAGVDPADGGGYFVLKNSWGRDRADQGYYYVPFGWMAANLIDVVAL